MLLYHGLSLRWLNALLIITYIITNVGNVEGMQYKSRAIDLKLSKCFFLPIKMRNLLDQQVCHL